MQLLCADCGGIFFNYKKSKLQEFAQHLVSCDGNITKTQLARALREGLKLNFLPADYKSEIESQADVLCEWLLQLARDGQLGQNGVVVVFDEVQEYCTDGRKDNGPETLVVTGLELKIRCISVTQRPAKTSKTLISQSERKIFFYPDEWDQAYLSTYKLPAAEIAANTKERYNFMLYEQGRLSGPFRI
jgi:hypothetical protein